MSPMAAAHPAAPFLLVPYVDPVAPEGAARSHVPPLLATELLP